MPLVLAMDFTSKAILRRQGWVVSCHPVNPSEIQKSPFLALESSLCCYRRRLSSGDSFRIRNRGAARLCFLLGFRNRTSYGIVIASISRQRTTQLVFELAGREAPHDGSAILVEDAVGACRGLVRKFVSQPEPPNANEDQHHKCDHTEIIIGQHSSDHERDK